MHSSHHHNSLQELAGRSWEWVNHVVDKLTPTQTAAIGGAGSGAAITAGMTADQVNSWLQTASLGVGVVVGIGSLGIVVLKLIQQRREMQQQSREHRLWAKNNPDA